MAWSLFSSDLKGRTKAFLQMVPELCALYNARRQRAERLEQWCRELTRSLDVFDLNPRHQWHLKQKHESRSANRCRACARSHVRHACVVPPKSRKLLVSPAVRFYVYDRDGYCCRYCGTEPDLAAPQWDPRSITVDHVVPWPQRQSSDPWELVTACWGCNSAKRDSVWVPGPRPTPCSKRSWITSVGERLAAIVFSDGRRNPESLPGPAQLGVGRRAALRPEPCTSALSSSPRHCRDRWRQALRRLDAAKPVLPCARGGRMIDRTCAWGVQQAPHGMVSTPATP